MPAEGKESLTDYEQPDVERLLGDDVLADL